MAKYILKNMDRGTEDSYDSLSAVKRAFIDASQTFKNLSVTESHNDELFVSLLDGVTHPGKHYRRFQQRGLVKPKAARAAAEPAPLVGYEAEQQAWVDKQHVRVGDKVTVLRKAKSGENGWNNEWMDYMNSSLGLQFQVKEITPTGIVLEDGVWNADYPYFVLEKEITVKDICRDVIAQLEAKRYLAAKGLFIKGSSIEKIKQACNYNGATSLQKVLLTKPITCSVCAKGGMFLSFVRLKNHVTVGQLHNIGEDGYDLRKKDWPADSLALFGRTFLDEIEIAFELCEYSWTSREISNARRRELVKKYGDIDDPELRLIKIMQDIIDDKF